MKRDIYSHLITWKTNPGRKPLLLRGARQVGKTYILQAFAEQEYNNYIYLNFEKHKPAHSLFEKDLDPQRILKDLQIYFDKIISPENTLLLFDEIQACPNALNSLKYFCEETPEYAIVAAGSLLDVKVANGTGFPVGKVNFLDLFPLNFFEFLDAIDKSQYRKLIEEFDKKEKISEFLHNELIELLKLYFFVGGMPEAVKEYVNTQNYQKIREIQQSILDTYALDFAKHAPPTQVMKITTLWELIPSQLAKENKKFIFSAIRKSARAREYETAIQWLVDAGLIYKSYQINTPKIPLDGYADKSIFKVFLLDVGLLGAMSQLPIEIMIEGGRLFQEFKGALTENYVAQELINHAGKTLYYWVSEGRAEVDFVTQADLEIYPLEVKSGKSHHKKSLLVYDEKYAPVFLNRASLLNFAQDGKIINYPLYAVGHFPALTKSSIST